MTDKPLRIDFVSDVTCPWCAIGLAALEQAIARVGSDDVRVELHVQPFELNPDMSRDGEPIVEYVRRKYGSSAEELAERQALIRQRGADVGFTFGTRTHVYNTFDAHRLLHWAGLEGKALALKHALLAAYHQRGGDPSRRDVLLAAAAAVGLDADEAGTVLASGAYADEVRASVRRWQQLGIHAVPSAIVDGRYLIQGGQPVEAYEQALRNIAHEARAAA